MKALQLAMFSGTVACAAAALTHAQQEASDVSRVALLAETTRVWPDQTILLGLHFELDEHWHIYWDGRNDTGFPATIDWTLPEGVSVGPMLWPAPERYVSAGGILDHVYEGKPTVLVPVTIEPGTLTGRTLTIAGEVEWLVCNDICLPGFGTVSIDLTIAPMGNSAPLEPQALATGEPIGKAASRLPKPILPGEQPEALTLRWSEEVATVVFEGADHLAFYPLMSCVSLVSMLDDAHAEGDTLRLRLASPENDLSEGDERRLVGVLEVKTDDGTSWHLIDFGRDGLRKPAHAELISRVRDRVAG